MGAFDDITLEWEGKPYIIKHNRVLGAIARIEDHITFAELSRVGIGKPPPTAKLAMAYATVLRYAGADVTAEDVYQRVFAVAPDEKKVEIVVTAVTVLLAMMIPPVHLSQNQGTPSRGKAAPTGAAGLSRKRTKRRSARLV